MSIVNDYPPSKRRLETRVRFVFPASVDPRNRTKPHFFKHNGVWHGQDACNAVQAITPEVAQHHLDAGQSVALCRGKPVAISLQQATLSIAQANELLKTVPVRECHTCKHRHKGRGEEPCRSCHWVTATTPNAFPDWEAA